MSLILHKAEDPRDTLSKASRYELCQVAAAHGIREVNYSAELTLEEMVKILRNKGINDIKIPDRPLGLYKPVVLGLDGPPLATVEEPEPEKPATPVAQMSMGELRSECKRRGIKMARTDNIHSLREKLS
jgi:hypothetical protein